MFIFDLRGLMKTVLAARSHILSKDTNVPRSGPAGWETSESFKLVCRARPHDFFPSGKTPYAEQDAAMDAITEFLSDDQKRVMIVLIPTAGGKSPLAAATANAWTSDGGVSVIKCPNKELQGQYRKDFGAGELSTVMGAVEFSCHSFPGETCASNKARRQCESRKLKMSDDGDGTTCPYQLHRIEAARTAKNFPLCFNPHSYLAFKKNEKLSWAMPNGNGLMIVDEAHLLPDQLRDFISISIDVALIERLLGSIGTEGSDGGFMKEFFYESDRDIRNKDNLRVSLVKAHQRDYLDILSELLIQTVVEIEKRVESGDFDWIRDKFPELDVIDDEAFYEYIEDLRTISERIEFVLKSLSETRWVAEFVRSGGDGDSDDKDDGGEKKATYKLLLRPTVIPSSFLRSYFNGFSKIILMSGTFFRTHLELLGLTDPSAEDPWENVAKFEVGSRIHPARRRIWIDTINGKRVNARNLDESFEHFAKIIVREITPRLRGERGMIHVSSHFQAELLAEKCREEALAAKRDGDSVNGRSPAIFITPKELGWRATFDKFIKMPRGKGCPNVYLIAARRYEGIDLAGDLARICIMAKAPIPYIKDTMIEALDAIYPGYSKITTLTAFVQGMNRTCRNPNDYSFNVCLDTYMDDLLRQFGGDVPEYIRDALDEKPEYADWYRSWRPPTE